jgi:hypothetical protein
MLEKNHKENYPFIKKKWLAELWITMSLLYEELVYSNFDVLGANLIE